MDPDTQPICIVCEKPSNQLMNLFGPKEFICRPCYAEQNAQIVEYKKGKPVLYSEIDHITDNVYLGNEDAAMDE